MSEFITIIRPSFMRFCKDACRAAAFNHLLFRIAGKSKDQPKEKIQAGDILWYAKTEQITEEMSDAWGVCKVRKEVNALIDMGLIGRRSNPAWGADRTKHFCFGQEQCRTFLQLCDENKVCFVHLDLSDEVKHLIYLSNANDISIKCICEIHQMETINVSNANDKCIRAITIDSPTKDDNKDDGKESVRVPAASSSRPSEDTPTDKPPEDKSSSRTKKPHWITLLDHWDSTQGKGPRPKWVLDEAKDLASRMEATPEQMDIVCAKLKTLGKPLTFESMYNHWHLLHKLPEGPPPTRDKPRGQPGKEANPANNLVALAAAQRAQRQQAAGGGGQ